MDDLDNIVPEFEAKYDTRFENTSPAGDEPGIRRCTIQVTRTYPVLKKLAPEGTEGDTYLIDHNGKKSVLKFCRPEMILHEKKMGQVKNLSEQFQNILIRVQDYGFDDTTKRWYVVEEYAEHGSFKDLSGRSIDLNLLVHTLTEALNILHLNNIVHLNLKPSNLLVREKQPLQIVLSDPDLFSITESGHNKRNVPGQQRGLYSSPEMISGISGREADYWSLGVILLELLGGKQPLDGLSEGSASDMPFAVNIPIPDHISHDQKILLQGLLTGNPAKRWGYAEVKKWLENDKDILAVFASDKGSSKRLPTPFRFLGEDYFSIEELIPAFLKSEEAWKAAIENLCEGHISQWLMKNFDITIGSRVDTIREQAGGDPHLSVISLIYSFKKDLPFFFYSEAVTLESLYATINRFLENRANPRDESIVQCLLSGRFIDYYQEYLILTSKDDDDLMTLLRSVRKAITGKNGQQEKLLAAFKILHIIKSPQSYVLPSNRSGNVTGNLDFIAGNIDGILTQEQHHELYNEKIGNLIVPDEIRQELNDALSSGNLSEYKRLKDGSLLTRTEFSKLQDKYIVPVWLENDLLGQEASAYDSAIRNLDKLKEDGLLVEKNGFLDYLKKNYRFVGHIVDKERFAGETLKGETFEEKWSRLVKSHFTYGEYIKLAGYIRNNVMLSVISEIEDIIKTVSVTAVSPESTDETIKYLDVLKSGRFKWDESDRHIVSEVKSLIFKGSSSLQFLDKLPEGLTGNLVRGFLKTIVGIETDDRTRETEFACAGSMVGLLTGIIAWIIIASLEFETSYYGPVALGIVAGLIRTSLPLIFLFASAGFLAVHFLEMGTAAEIVYAFWIAIIGGAKLGGFLGKKTVKTSPCDEIFRKHNARMREVVNAAEHAQ